MISINTLNDVLKSFKIDAICVDFKQHRHFSFYDLQLRPGCRISKINLLSKELALALKTRTIPMIKPISEQGIVRLQLTHKSAELLTFDELCANATPGKGILPFLLGETDEGQQLWMDMSQNPHLLVAGATGSGKTVLLHNIIANAARRKDTKLFLIDTKKVEFTPYENSIELVDGVATDYISAVSILEHLYEVMESRFNYLNEIGCSSIEQDPDMMDKILVIIDEAADLMLMDKTGQFESYLVRLAAKSRAAGIYIVLATQRPSVDVLTGLIKANFPARLACKVSSRIDSQIIIDRPGAEHLLGKGDALFKSPTNDDVRLQIAYVKPSETIAKLAE